MIAWAMAAPVLAAPPIEFELVSDPGFPLDGSRRWMQALSQLEPAALRIRAGTGNDQPRVENIGTEQSPRYRVVGVLTDRSQLLLPGGKFSERDTAGIERWLQKLREDGIQDPHAERAAFGLTPAELTGWHDKLTRPVGFSTRGQRAGEVARRLVREAALEVVVSPAAQAAFARQESCGDELEHLTAGTGLAAVIRPLGLVMAPKKSAGRITLHIAELAELSEFWPVGWPLQEPPYKAAPELFESLTVVITNRSYHEAVSAVVAKGAITTPFLYDHNALARHGIDLAGVTVSHPRKQVTYKRLLDQLFFQAKLTGELRADEAGTAFLWITTAKR